MLSPSLALPLVPLAFLLACAAGTRSIAPAPTHDEAQAAFDSLVESTKWLKGEKPELFAELEEKLW